MWEAPGSGGPAASWNRAARVSKGSQQAAAQGKASPVLPLVLMVFLYRKSKKQTKF